jgi:glyoxylase-like metal-dependent hydrolase (beta-lactamase superfamily II)
MALTTTVDDVAPDVVRLRHLFVNVYFIGTADNWVLVDAGLPGSADEIVKAAEERFGAGTKPSGIVMTHGHFDHVGAFPELFEHWDVPVWAHVLELPHLIGEADYPPPDPTVGKGAMALMSFAYPNKAIDLGSRVRALPLDSAVPYLLDWRWIHTPGHTRGHISLFRESDGILIAGDAFVTVEQESLYKVVTQKQEVHGPPAYFTPDWKDAEESIRILQELQPMVAATGHGTPMEGQALSEGLLALVADFDEVAIPNHGRYVPKDSQVGA